MKILSLRYKLSSESERKSFAKSLSYIIEAGDTGCLPYKPNENDDYFWTLDTGNDWKVRFFEDDEKSFGLIYRYESEWVESKEKILAEWVKIRFGAVEK